VLLLTSRDEVLRPALERAARPDEAVVADPGGVQAALTQGWARAHVCDDRRGVVPEGRAGVPVLFVSPEMVSSWERERQRAGLMRSRAEHYGTRLSHLLAVGALQATWVDGLLADLARSSGGPLPLGFRAFARHALEFPARYRELADIGSVGGLTPGALKARFRRRGLESPYTYLRWLRSLAVAELLADRSITIAQAARRLGFTSDTNMCRMVRVVTGATPGMLRDPGARRRLTFGFAQALLGGDARSEWRRLDDVFGRGKAA